MRPVNRHDDEGAVIIWVAIMMVVLFGVGALVIDIGALYVERRQLQNGADAAALAVAQDCAEGECGADGGSALAQTYANLNANDDVSAIESGTPCGSDPDLPACTDGAPSGVDGATGWVRVGTSTETADGGDEVSFVLAPIISALTGRTVRANAAAAWGPMGGGPATPLVFSQCEWEALGGNLADGTFPTGLATITFHGTNPSSVDCPIGPSGLDLPGGFGRVIAPTCEASLEAGQWASVDTGANLAAECDVQSWQNQVVLIAVFDETNGLTGANGAYRIAGFVGFRVLGYRIVASGGGGGVQTFGSCTPDSPSDQYLCGEFTLATTDGSQFGTGADFGARIIKMVE